MEYEYSFFMEDGLGTAFGIFYVIYMLVMLCIAIAGYVFNSLGLYTIAKRRGISKPWLSWLPVGGSWIMGSISDQFRYVTKGQIKSKRKIMVGLEAAVWVVYIVVFAVTIARVVDLVMHAQTLGEEAAATNLAAVMLGLMGMMVVVMVVAIAFTVFYYMAMYDLYTSLNPANNVLFLLLSIFLGICTPYLIFFNRKKDLGMPPRCEVPVEPVPPVYLPPQPPVQEPWDHPAE